MKESLCFSIISSAEADKTLSSSLTNLHFHFTLQILTVCEYILVYFLIKMNIFKYSMAIVKSYIMISQKTKCFFWTISYVENIQC